MVPGGGEGRRRLLGALSGVALVVAVLCVSFAHRNAPPTVLSSEEDLSAAARMQGWSDVEKFRLHLKALQPSHASLCATGSILGAPKRTQLEAVAAASKASSTKAGDGVGDGILSFLESAVFGGSASVSPQESSALAGQQGGHQVEKMLPVDDSTIVMAQPLKNAPSSAAHSPRPRIAAASAPPPPEKKAVAPARRAAAPDASPTAEKKAVRGARLEATLAGQHPKEAEEAVDTMEAEARALGYQVVPTRLFNEAKRLGYTLAPETKKAAEEEEVVKARARAGGTGKARGLAIVGGDGEDLAQTKARVTDTRAQPDAARPEAKAAAPVAAPQKRTVAAISGKGSARGGGSSESQGKKEAAPAAAAQAGAAAARDGAEASERHAAARGGSGAARGGSGVAHGGSGAARATVVSYGVGGPAAERGGLSASDAQRLAREREDEEANQKHLEEVHRSASAAYRKQIVASSRRAAQDANKAIDRYGSIFTFAGHEGVKEAVSNPRDRVVHQQLADGARAEAASQKKLREYARLLSFSGHEGREGAHVSPAVVQQLEEGKRSEFEGAEQESRGRAAEQLKKYDLFRFHDESVARRELAHQRLQHKALGGGEQARGRLEGAGRARLDRGQAKLLADAAKAGFAVVPPRVPGQAGGGAGLEQWDGRGVPRFS